MFSAIVRRPPAFHRALPNQYLLSEDHLSDAIHHGLSLGTIHSRLPLTPTCFCLLATPSPAPVCHRPSASCISHIHTDTRLDIYLVPASQHGDASIPCHRIRPTRPDLCHFKLPYRCHPWLGASNGTCASGRAPRFVCVCIYATYIYLCPCQHARGATRRGTNTFSVS